MDLSGVSAVLDELRVVGGDHRSVEAKRAQHALPESTHETLSAFANSDGGILLLGVDEAGGAFHVTGVAETARVMSDLQSLCAQMVPPLRAMIDAVQYGDGVVIVAEIAPVPRDQRPCYRGPGGPENGSFIRVGDADQRLTQTEVATMLANRSRHDHSASPAPEGAELDSKQAANFVRAMRATTDRYADVDDDVVLRQFGVLKDGSPTVAGMLLLGDNPQRLSPAARVTYRRLPRAIEPPGTRYSGKHLEGTVGELLDDVVSAALTDLRAIQVYRDGALVDEVDVPLEALRELVSNALIHRSLAPVQADTPVLVAISDESVDVTSPGSLHYSEDPAMLGLVPISGVRNHTMVRIGELLRTPTGARIVEHQTSGIAAADRACRAGGTMPALFIDGPLTFQAILLRGRLETSSARARLAAAGLPESDEHIRLLAVLEALTAILASVPSPGLNDIVFDARFAARALSPCAVEDAAAELRALEDFGVLRRIRVRRVPAWTLADPIAPSPEPVAEATAQRHSGRSRQDRVPEVLAAIAASASGSLGASEIGEALKLTSPTSRGRWLRAAQESGFVESSAQSPFDPTARYSLTATGAARVRAVSG